MIFVLNDKEILNCIYKLIINILNHWHFWQCLLFHLQTCFLYFHSHGSSESDQVDARSPGMAHTSGQVPYSTTVSAVLSANAQLPFTGDAMNSTAVMSDEVLQV